MKRALLSMCFAFGLHIFGYAEQMADFSICVTDDDGRPISNATVSLTYMTAGGFFSPEGRVAHDTYATIKKPSDTKGMYHYRGPFNVESAWGLRKTGYYDTVGMKFDFTNGVGGCLQPWGVQINGTLRRIVNPIGMYASTMDDPKPVRIPELGKPFGFDLMKSDWVVPYGGGKVADFILQLESEDAKVPEKYYEKFPRAIRQKNETLTLTFSNPDDGIQVFYSDPRGSGSKFRSPRYAPESGYATNLISMYRADMGQVRNDKHENQNYIFRVRTKRDQQGVITNAFYGKIYGPIGYCAPYVGCTYYLNPSSLDRNLEFDQTKNLLRGVLDANQLPIQP